MTRRQLMRHSAWFGAAVVLTVAGGEVISHVAGAAGDAAAPNRPICASPKSATATSVSRAPPTRTSPARSPSAIDQINDLGYTPDFVIHTGDLTHLATPGAVRPGQADDDRAEHPARVHRSRRARLDRRRRAEVPQAFGAGTRGDGWYSFDIAGVHVIGLVNTLNMTKLGHLGDDQLEFVRKDVAPCPATPRSWCSATSRCSRCIPTGAGAPTMPRRR